MLFFLIYSGSHFNVSSPIFQLQGKSDAQCLVIDDSLLLPLTALHISNGSRVISLSPGLQENAARYLEAIADSNGFSEDRFEYFREGKAKLTEAFPSKVIHVIYITFKESKLIVKLCLLKSDVS